MNTSLTFMKITLCFRNYDIIECGFTRGYVWLSMPASHSESNGVSYYDIKYKNNKPALIILLL